MNWAKKLGISNPCIIGWDFPILPQEQINVYNMHGYTAALILDDGVTPSKPSSEVIHQRRQTYIAITIKQPFTAPFYLIPNAYKTLDTYMRTNGIHHKNDLSIICNIL